MVLVVAWERLGSGFRGSSRGRASGAASADLRKGALKVDLGNGSWKGLCWGCEGKSFAFRMCGFWILASNSLSAHELGLTWIFVDPLFFLVSILINGWVLNHSKNLKLSHTQTLKCELSHKVDEKCYVNIAKFRMDSQSEMKNFTFLDNFAKFWRSF